METLKSDENANLPIDSPLDQDDHSDPELEQGSSNT